MVRIQTTLGNPEYLRPGHADARAADTAGNHHSWHSPDFGQTNACMEVSHPRDELDPKRLRQGKSRSLETKKPTVN